MAFRSAAGGARGAAAAAPPAPGVASWLAIWVYQPLFLLAFLVYSPVLLWRLLAKRPVQRTDLRQRLGFVTRPATSAPLVWIHGVSVGEVKAASSFVVELRRRRPDLQLLVSTTTANGRRVAGLEYPDLPIVYYPMDITTCPARALSRLQPRCVLLMELEIWPNFLQAARRRDIPVAVINGRISERTFRGYRLGRWLLPQLDFISRYCVQDRAYQDRLLALGIDPGRVFVTGNMKYDSVVMGRHEAVAGQLRAWLAAGGERVLVAGSTHADEEERLLAAVAGLEGRLGIAVRVVLVPRHPERAAAICDAAAAAGRTTIRWTNAAGLPPLAPGQLVVVDTIGQLQRFYAACDVAFVGGSLVPHGGQNMLEPAALGRAVMFGPHTANFRRDVELLRAAGAVAQVADWAEFTAVLGELLADAGRCAALGERARQVIRDNQGATSRTLDLVADLLAAPAADGAVR